MSVLATAVTHAAARPTMSSPDDIWLKKRECPENKTSRTV